MIREPVAKSQPTAQVGANVASSSRLVVHWRPTFKFGIGPLPAIASVKVWDKGERGRVAQNLVHDLLLPEDVHFFTEGDEDLLVRQL